MFKTIMTRIGMFFAFLMYAILSPLFLLIAAFGALIGAYDELD